MRTSRRVWCPHCDEPIDDVDVTWPSLRAWCSHCEQDIFLSEYVEPTSGDGWSRQLRPVDLAPPRRPKLKRSAAPGGETFRIGGMFIATTVRIDRDGMAIVGVFEKERRFQREDIAGFVALQHVAQGAEEAGAGALGWHLLIATAKDSLLPLRVFRDRQPARYFASELQRALLRHWGESPYRG